MSSYRSPLSPMVSAGWNDPPILSGNESKAQPSHLMQNKYRRPVDPSIQANYAQAPAYASTQQQNLYQSPQNFDRSPQHFDHSPQQFGHSPQNFDQSTGVYHQSPTSHPTAFQVPTTAPPMNTSPHDPYAFAFTNRPINPPLTGQMNITSQIPVTVSGYEVPASGVHPIDSHPSALIFAPPNSVAPDHRRPLTQPDPIHYVAPLKAAGDVSLNGAQLVSFLTKATLKLTPGATCEGIQLRIGQLDQMLRAGRISEQSIKRLNFVVDAIDRGKYDEAWSFFEHLQTETPSEELATWAQGVRILIGELRRQSSGSRAGSAGSQTRHM